MRIHVRVGKLARIVIQDKNAWFVPALFDVHGLAESFPRLRSGGQSDFR